MDRVYQMQNGIVFWLFARTNEYQDPAALWALYDQTYPGLPHETLFVQGRVRLLGADNNERPLDLATRFSRLLAEPLLERLPYSMARGRTDGSVMLMFPLQSVQQRSVGRKASMKRALQLILGRAANLLGCDYVCYLGYPHQILQFREALDDLDQFFQTVASQQNTVIVVDELSGRDDQELQIAQTHHLLDLILRGSRVQFLKQLEETVNAQLGDIFEAKVAFRLSMNFSQLFHVALYESGIPASEAFVNPNTISKEDTIHSKRSLIATTMKQFDLTIAAIARHQVQESLFGQIQQYIQEHITGELSRETIAKEFFLHPDYLSHYFHKQAGVTLASYIRMARVREARLLLDTTDLPVSEVAYQVGYQSPSYFTKAFLREVGVKPSDYRSRK